MQNSMWTRLVIICVAKTYRRTDTNQKKWCNKKHTAATKTQEAILAAPAQPPLSLSLSLSLSADTNHHSTRRQTHM